MMLTYLPSPYETGVWPCMHPPDNSGASSSLPSMTTPSRPAATPCQLT